jgi:RNA methyltransferase, TrmH family
MLSRTLAGRLHALQRRRGREETGEFLVEGVRLVEDLLASTVVPRIALLSTSLEDTPRGRSLAGQLRARVECVAVSDADLSRIGTTETPQGVAVVAVIPRAELSSVVIGDDGLLIVLDAIQDPGNFGTIVRCADAFGATAVATLPGTVDPWNPKSVRSAAGASLRLPIVSTDLATIGALIHERDGAVVGAAREGDDVEDVARTIARPIALVLGNEGAGLTHSTRVVCDRIAAVPIRGSAESLNVAVAAGILMYILTRQA